MDSWHEEVAHSLFREANDALFLFDPKDHRVLDANPAALRLTGLDKEAACTLRLHDLFAGGEPGMLDHLIDAYRKTGFYHSREGYFLLRQSGEAIPVNVSVSRIHTQPAPLGLVVARDITERIRAQQALRESEARYRGLVEAAKLFVWTMTADRSIESLNPAFEAITGWPCATWIGRPFTDLILPEDLAAADESFARAVGDPQTRFEFRILSASGEAVALEVLAASCQPRDGRTIISGIARDITELRRAEVATRHAEAMRRAKEAAEAADRAKGDFLGHISHEIRTPMTAILGFTDILLRDERVRALPAELVGGLRTIEQNGGHLLSLIDDILDLTKIEAGRLRVDWRPCSPARTAMDVAASLRPRAEARGLVLAVEVAPEVPAIIVADEVRLRQILINLLSNAIKFTPAGSIRLHLDYDSDASGPAPLLHFGVSDTGIGISAAELDRLFEPFYTTGARTTRESGAGLGLAISRRLAGLLGGRLDVQSRPGEGSTFTLTLPIASGGVAGRALTDVEPRDNGLPGPAHFLHGKILLAEDNESIRRFVALRLQQCGAEVAIACNGQEAIDIALDAWDAGRPFDWILMDMQMPVLDGYEATVELRGRGYRGPIIALTAFATDENRDESLRFGCDAHLSKPVDWDQLLATLAAIRGRSGEARAASSPAEM